MPSLIPDYEYDIFISYRQKDNKLDGWVTTFVSNLKKELEAAFKEDISIYFDQNPNDGILETNHVDETVSAKIKCLVFIPILSQTYCDPKSFAWSQEFKTYISFAKEDQFGLNVKLLNGNTACRVLPVRIHELEPADKQLVEAELGGVLRAIDFVYRSAGVVRTLQQNEDDPKANLNHTFYRDQMSKVVRGIKELITAMQSPAAAGKPTVRLSPESVPVSARKKLSLVAAAIIILGVVGYVLFYFTGFGNKFFKAPDKSIAVLPFENMNRDSTQDYFSNGIAEDILNHLVKIADLKVKSRTSTLQYKGTTKTMSEIGDELNVSNVVEGSVRRVGDKVRIVVQLIDTESDTHLWSETYDRDLKDVLALQSEIALEIAKALQARLSPGEKTNIQKQVSQSITAYDYLLKARDVMNHYNERRDLETAFQFVNQAIQMDPGFAQAYAYKGLVWFYLRYYGISQQTWQDSAMYFSSRAIALDPSAPHGYQVQGQVYQYLGKLKEAKEAFYKAYQASPNDTEVLNDYGLQLLRDGEDTGASLVLKSLEAQYSPKDPEYYERYGNLYGFIGEIATAEELLRKYKSLSPGAIDPYLSLSILYRETGQFEKAIIEAEQAEKINPASQRITDELAWLHYENNDLERAAKYWLKLQEIEAGFEDSTQILPFRHRLGMVYSKIGKKKEADALFAEDFKKYSEIASGQRGLGAWGGSIGSGGIFYSLAVDLAYFGNDARAVQYLDSAFQREFNVFYLYRNDPMFSNLRKREDFKKMLKKVNDRELFLKNAYRKALNQAEASKELKRLMEK